MIIPGKPYPPTNDLVAVAWLSQRVAGLDDSMVATNLPAVREDGSLPWGAAGFLQAVTVTGTPEVDVPIRHALVQCDAWAATIDAAGTISRKPPWGRAAVIAELVRVATEEQQVGFYSKPVTLPADFAPARVLAAYLLTEPSRVTGDPSGYARVTFDLMIDWTRA